MGIEGNDLLRFVDADEAQGIAALEQDFRLEGAVAFSAAHGKEQSFFT